MSAYQLITVGTDEPLTLEEAKLHLRVDGTEEDTLIYALLVAARDHAENYTWRRLTECTMAVYYDRDEVENFIFVNKNVQSIEAVKYKDSTGSYQTLSPSSYEVDLFSHPCRIRVTTKPQVADKLAAWKVEFTAGYASPSEVQEPIKAALKLIIGHLYEHREDVTMSSNYTLENGAKYLLEPYKLPTYFI
jgi:uncharacterized phiE125 gp8 family phage protein